MVYVPPVAAGALLSAAGVVGVADAAADVAAVGADEAPGADEAAALVDVFAVAAGFDDEHATRLAITATDSAVVLPTRRPIVDVFTDFLPRLGMVLLAQEMRKSRRPRPHEAKCTMIEIASPNRFANRFDRP
jgi:hypothetical protein